MEKHFVIIFIDKVAYANERKALFFKHSYDVSKRLCRVKPLVMKKHNRTGLNS